jgi:hypothetical protein
MIWSAGDIQAVIDIDAETLAEVAHAEGSKPWRKDWIVIQTAQRLAWMYGDERAAAILNGEDPETQADLAAWGGRSANNRLPCAAA